jgi:ABC-type Zn uptake system ZnuABC Zn-binding protein ZnuA
MKRDARVMTLLALALAAAVLLAGCGGGATGPAIPAPGQAGGGPSSPAPIDLAPGQKLQVVATTSIVWDVVANVGGGLIDLQLLMPVGTDPHGFEPRPQDVTALAAADVIMANGAGLETFLNRLLESTGASYRVVQVSDGIDLLQLDSHSAEGGNDGSPEVDPHTWTDPNNVLVWVDNIQAALSALDPAHAADYERNATAYRAELESLDSWIGEEVAQIPEAQRKIVSDHETFGYLAHRYGLTQTGAIFAGGTTLAQPSAKELAALEAAIKELGVKAIFVGSTVSPDLARAIAEDTGVKLVTLYTGSLTQGGEADTYLDYMKANVSAIVDALR